MSTGKNAAEALRKIHFFRTTERHTNLMYERAISLNDIGHSLEKYAADIGSVLDDAYNRKARLDQWNPTTLVHVVLVGKEVWALQYLKETNEAAIRSSTGFKALEEAAQNLDVLFKICVLGDKISVICDFLAQVRGKVEVVLV